MTLLNAVFFYWLQVSVPRLIPEYERNEKLESLKTTTYIAHGLMSLIMLCGVISLEFLFPISSIPSEVIWLSLALAFVRALLNMNQAFHKSLLNFKKYNILECGQAVLGLVIGVILVYCFNMGVAGAIYGMVAAIAIMLLTDIKIITTIIFRKFSYNELVQIFRLGWPLVLTFALGFIVSSSDRFILGHYCGADDLGVYAAGYNLADRIMTLVFMLVATPSFPLTIHKLENEGHDSANRQVFRNGEVLALLAIPAAGGLIMAAPQLAEILVGEDFRSGVREILPWITVSSFLNGITSHYFYYAFHLAKRPKLFLVAQLPIAVINIILNVILIQKYDYMGAVYSTVISYFLLMVMSIILGRLTFKITFPVKTPLYTACAVLVMCMALRTIDFSLDVKGLIEMVIVGFIAYISTMLLFNVMSLRTELVRLITSRLK